MNRELSVIGFALVVVFHAHSQGTFVNLDFEASSLPTNGPSSIVSVGDAVPAWTVYRGSEVQNQIRYNAFSGFPVSAVDLWANTKYPSHLYGDFAALFEVYDSDGAALGQIGQVPLDAYAVQFKTRGFPVPPGDFAISFNAIPLSLQLVGSFSTNNATFDLWSADISGFQGMIGELRIGGLALSGTHNFLLDDIEFVAVPEPTTWALLGLGMVAFAFLRRWNRE